MLQTKIHKQVKEYNLKIHSTVIINFEIHQIDKTRIFWLKDQKPPTKSTKIMIF